MSAPVTLPNAIHSEAIRPQVGEAARISIAEAGRPALPIGRIVEVMISTNGQAQQGILLQGQYYPAKIPENARSGQRLRAQVVSNQDALVLRVMFPESTAGAAPSPSAAPTTARDALALVLRNIASESQLASLRKAIASPQTKVPDGSPSVQQALGDLADNQLLASEQHLQEATHVLRILSELGSGPINRHLAPVREAIARSQSDQRLSLRQRFVEALEKQLSHILSRPFEGEVPEEAGNRSAPDIRPHLETALRLSHYAMGTGNARLLSGLAERLSGTESKNSALMLLMRTLGVFLDSADVADGGSQPAGEEAEFVAFITQLARDITQHIERRANPKEIRASLSRALDALRASIAGSSQRSAADRTAADEVPALRALEQLLRGQEALQILNPVVQAFGEPAMLFMPVLLQGILQRWEFQFFRPPVDANDEQAKSGKRGYERVTVHAALPNLGSMSIEIAVRPGEILAHIALENRDAATYLASKLPDLETQLRARGVSAVQLIAECKPSSESARISWLAPLLHRGVIA